MIERFIQHTGLRQPLMPAGRLYTHPTIGGLCPVESHCMWCVTDGPGGDHFNGRYGIDAIVHQVSLLVRRPTYVAGKFVCHYSQHSFDREGQFDYVRPEYIDGELCVVWCPRPAPAEFYLDANHRVLVRRSTLGPLIKAKFAKAAQQIMKDTLP